MKRLKKIDNFIRHMNYIDIVGIGLLVLSLVIGITGYIRVHGQFDMLQFLNDFYANASTELGSIAITVIIVDQLARRRDRKEAESREKRGLIVQLYSVDNVTVLNVISQMRAMGWLFDGSLQGAKLSRVNFRGIQLDEAQLSGVNFEKANLKEASLAKTNLRNANLYRADFADAKLWGTDLEGAILDDANLRGADMRGANLFQVKFVHPDKLQVNERDYSYRAKYICDENTILPDGTKWTAKTDMSRFTDPKHPDFWQPDWVKEQKV